MNPFSSTYEAARALFQETAEAAGYRSLRFRVPHEDSAELFLDFALLRRDPQKVVIHFSGVHGIEGFAGSAVQASAMTAPPSEDGPSLLFVHGVNAYGMALYRRANGQNVDLNRNYRKGPANPNPAYARFAPFLNPETPSDFRWGKIKALWAAARLGAARTGQAVASGQVTHPRGLFFMGYHVQREIFLAQEFLRAHCGEARQVVALDLHTGLGPWGGEQLFSDDPDLNKIYGVSPTPRTAYDNQGRFENAVRDALPNAHLRYSLQEFGTRKGMAVVEALRAENIEWQRRAAATPRPEPIVKAMMDAFCPEDPAWRQTVLRLGLERWRQAEAFLRNS